jgi:hypothetical protein
MLLRPGFIAGLFLLTAASAQAQQGYEFEVYRPEIGAVASSEIELSTNYAATGLPDTDEGLFATHHAFRSSLEVNRTLSNWLQATAYLTVNKRPGHALAYVGNRFKITTVAPSTWSFPVELGFVNELSYARPGFAEDPWTYEITPIVGKTFGPVSLVFNPAFERGFSGSGVHHVEVEPRGAIAYGLGDETSVALEYYAGLGGLGEHYSVAEQRHQIFAKFVGEVSRHLEFNIGVGRGLTMSSDRWVITSALEYSLGR